MNTRRRQGGGVGSRAGSDRNSRRFRRSPRFCEEEGAAAGGRLLRRHAPAGTRSLSDGGSLGRAVGSCPTRAGEAEGPPRLTGIVRDEEAPRRRRRGAAAAEAAEAEVAAAAAAARGRRLRGEVGGRPKERPKEHREIREKAHVAGRGVRNDDAARSKGARAPRRGMTDANDPKKRLSRTTPPSTDALDRTLDSRAKAPARKPSRKSPTDIGGDVCEASARGSSRESDVCSFSHAARAVDERKKKTASSDAPETRAGGRRSRRARPKPTDGT